MKKILKLEDKSIALAIKVRKKDNFDCSDIINMHWTIYDKIGYCWYSTNLRVSNTKLQRIKKLYLFGTNTNGEKIIVETEVSRIIKRKIEDIPIEIKKISIPEAFKEEEKNVWFRLKNFKVIDIEETDLKLTYKDGTLREKILIPERSNMFYVNIKEEETKNYQIFI